MFDGEGQWRNPATGTIAREPTKILLVAAPRSPDLAPRLSAVIEAYKTRFRQQSVGDHHPRFLRRVLTRGCRAVTPSRRPGPASGAAAATPR